MPVLVKIDYSITAPVTIQIIRVDFDKKISAELAQDRQTAPPPTFKSSNPPPGTRPYIVSPINQFINLFVFGIAAAGGGLGTSFTMEVTFTIVDDNFIPLPDLKPFSPPVTLRATLDPTGKAVLDTSVRWKA